MAQATGFQPTYEELKQEGLAVLGRYLGSFQPTYEELKPYGIVKEYVNVEVSSLPMRN